MTSPMLKPCSASNFGATCAPAASLWSLLRLRRRRWRAPPIRDPSLILILSDINMPGMSGLEMLPKVRAERPDVPVIMITAYGDAETRRKAIERGAVGLLTKPIDFALLRHEIDTQAWAGRMTATVLVVDDEPDLEALVLQKFRKQIRDGVMTFLFAHDGIEALQSIEHHPHVDMVVSDINMPRMDGLSLLQKLQEAETRNRPSSFRLWRHEQYPHRDEPRRIRFSDQADRFRRSRNDHRQDHSPRRDHARGASTPDRSRTRACLAVAVFFAADRLPAGRRWRSNGMEVHRREVAVIFTDITGFTRWWRLRRRRCWARCSTNMWAA